MRKANIQEILSSKKPKIGNILFIAIDGHGGSGKSTLAKLVSENLEAQIIRTDDFASWENPFDWWPLIIEKIFKPIENGAKTLSYQRSKWWDNHNPESVVDQPVTDIMILEGVGSLRKEFRKYISLGIFIDAPKNICMQRGVVKDLGTGKSQEELTKMWKRWLSEEDKYFKRDNPQAHADMVIDGTKPFEDQLKL